MDENPERGLFALVSYVPDPLASVLYRLRTVLPEPYDAEPHITLLPPRPLQNSLDSACAAISSILSLQAAFEVRLSVVDHFAATNTVYLRVEEGFSELNDLHAVLNQGQFQHQEPFHFRPHLTVGGPIDADCMSKTLSALSHAWRAAAADPCFLLDEVTFLHQEGSGPWCRVKATQLKPAPRVGRTCLADPA